MSYKHDNNLITIRVWRLKPKSQPISYLEDIKPQSIIDWLTISNGDDFFREKWNYCLGTSALVSPFFLFFFFLIIRDIYQCAHFGLQQHQIWAVKNLVFSFFLSLKWSYIHCCYPFQYCFLCAFILLFNTICMTPMSEGNQLCQYIIGNARIGRYSVLIADIF